MKITVSQLRKIIKEEISRALNESNGEEILKKVQDSIFLRTKLKQMVNNPGMQQQIADMWDEALSKVPEMMVYIRAKSDPGYINSKARNEAILSAASSFSDPEAANYLNAALDNKELNLNGADLLSAAAAAEAADHLWNSSPPPHHPHSHQALWLQS